MTENVLNTFSTLPDIDVNVGDVEVCRSTGNLLVVSNTASSIAELTPGGTFVQSQALPAGVTSLSGIGIDDATGEAWVSGTGGGVWQLGDMSCSGIVVPVLPAWGRWMLPPPVLVVAIAFLRLSPRRAFE